MISEQLMEITLLFDIYYYLLNPKFNKKKKSTCQKPGCAATKIPVKFNLYQRTWSVDAILDTCINLTL